MPSLNDPIWLMIDLGHVQLADTLREFLNAKFFNEVASMNVTEIMASAVQLVKPDDNLVAAAKLMKEFDIGCLLVASESRVVGIVTDRDLVLRGLSSSNDVSEISVAEVMTPDPMFCTVDDTVRQVARIMEDSQIRRLPVLNADRTVAGIVSLGDVCTHTPHNIAGELIEEVSRPAHHELAESV